MEMGWMRILESSTVWGDVQSVTEVGCVQSLGMEICQRCWNSGVSPNIKCWNILE